MSKELEALIELARNTRMTPAQKEAQRQSFAYGNTKIENTRITRASVEAESERLAKEAQPDGPEH